jgi:hypothetical protein
LCELDDVDLSVQKDNLPVDRTSLDTSLVRDVHEIEVVEDLVDVLFPQSTGFGVSLVLSAMPSWLGTRVVSGS